MLLKIKDVSLDLRAGEVIGLAGLEGSGQGHVHPRLLGVGAASRRPGAAQRSRPDRQVVSHL